MIRYKGYLIKRFDRLNWEVIKEEKAVAPRDMVSPKTQKVSLKKGEEYVRASSLGFFSDVGRALRRIVRDLAGEGCEDIKALAAQIEELKADLGALLDEEYAQISVKIEAQYAELEGLMGIK